MIGLIPFPKVLVLCEMQSVLSRIWTRVAVSISYDDNHYTTGTSIPPYHPSLLAGRLSWILYPHKANVSPCWSPGTGTSLCRSPEENVVYEFVLAFQAVSRMSYSSYLDGFWDNFLVGWYFQDLFKTAWNILR